MKGQPTIETKRLVLRPFSPEDAHVVQELAGHKDIASTTLNIPHPYEDGMAEEWIATHEERYRKGEAVIFAIRLREGDRLMGSVGLEISAKHGRAELGYWVAKPCWGMGYATEAAAAVVDYGFDALGLNRIFARHLTRNPASGRVIQKIGMTHEGSLREHVKKWDVFEDMEFYGILRDEFYGET